MNMKSKKGMAWDRLLIVAPITMVVAILILAMGADVTEDIRSEQVNGSGSYTYDYDYNITISGLEGLGAVSGKMDTIGLVVAIAIILTLLIGALAQGLIGGRGI